MKNLSKNRAKAEDIRRGRARQRSSAYLIPGERAVAELLSAAPVRAKCLYFEGQRQFPELEALARSLEIEVQRVDRDRLDEMVGFGLARGVVLEASPPTFVDLDAWLAIERTGPAIAIALDEVGDPQNFGAIMRTAEFFGAAGVLWAKDRCAPLSPLAVRASVGASERLALCPTTNLVRTLEACKQAGWWIVGTSLEESQDLEAFAGASPPERIVLVLGSEGTGMRRLTTETCDFRITVPRLGEVGSLNVSVAAAVCISRLVQAQRSASRES